MLKIVSHVTYSQTNLQRDRSRKTDGPTCGLRTFCMTAAVLPTSCCGPFESLSKCWKKIVYLVERKTGTSPGTFMNPITNHPYGVSSSWPQQKFNSPVVVFIVITWLLRVIFDCRSVKLPQHLQNSMTEKTFVSFFHCLDYICICLICSTGFSFF